MTGVRFAKRKPASLYAIGFKAPVIGTASDKPITAHQEGFLAGRPNDLDLQMIPPIHATSGNPTWAPLPPNSRR